MTHKDILALDLTLDVKMWSIKILMEKGLNRSRTLGVPRGMLCVRSQRPVSRSSTEYALRTEEYAQQTQLGQLGRVGSTGC